MTRDLTLRSYDLRPALEGAAIAWGLLQAEHIGLYRWRGRLPLPVRYTLGVAALGLGLAHACAERHDLRPLYDAALIAACGGALVTTAHGLRYVAWRRSERGRKEREDAAVYRAARLGGA